MGEGDRNLVLIALMVIIPFMLFIQFPVLKWDERYTYLLVVAIFFSGVLHLNTFRVSTLMYSVLFIVTFVYYKRVLYSGVIEINSIKRILKFLLIAHCLTIIIQQLSILLELPYVFNQIHIWPESRFKLNGLSAEPSHTARILVILMYSYVKLTEYGSGQKYNLLQGIKDEIIIWISFLFPMLTMGSGGAFFFLPFFFIQFFSKKTILKSIILSIIAFVIILNSNFVPVVRAINFAKAVVSMNPENMLIADHSASMRLVPFFIYLDNFHFLSLNSWLGWGIDYNVLLFPKYIPGVIEDTNIGGVLPNFLLNFGLLSGFFLFVFLFKYCFRRVLSLEFLLWMLMISSVPFNAQIFWFSIILFSTIEYMRKTMKNKEMF